MTEKLEIVQIEESEEESQVMKLSETYWKDYLRDNEYNKDPNKMCELCIEEQILVRMRLIHKEPVHAQLLKGHGVVLGALIIELLQPRLQ